MDETLQYTPNDVLLGRHRDSFRHTGNVIFRDIIKSYAMRYEVAQTRKHKMAIVAQVKWAVQKNGGKFMQKSSGVWMKASMRTIQAKISHALRDYNTKIKGRPTTKKLLTIPSSSSHLSSASTSLSKLSSSSAKIELGKMPIAEVVSSVKALIDADDTTSTTSPGALSDEPCDQLANKSWVEFYARQFASIDVDDDQVEYKKKEIFVKNSVQDIYSLFVEDLYELDNNDVRNLLALTDLNSSCQKNL